MISNYQLKELKEKQQAEELDYKDHLDAQAVYETLHRYTQVHTSPYSTEHLTSHLKENFLLAQQANMRLLKMLVDNYSMIVFLCNHPLQVIDIPGQLKEAFPEVSINNNRFDAKINDTKIFVYTGLSTVDALKFKGANAALILFPQWQCHTSEALDLANKNHSPLFQWFLQ
jgi:hypothetical protein